MLIPCFNQRKYFVFNFALVFLSIFPSQNFVQQVSELAKKSSGSLNRAAVAVSFLEESTGSLSCHGEIFVGFGEPSKLTILTCLNL